MSASDVSELSIPTEAAVRFAGATMTQVVMALGPDLQVRYANAPASELIGIAEAAAPKCNLKDTIANPLAVEISKRVAELLSTGQDTIFEVHLSGRTWLSHVVPLRDTEGVPRALSVFCHDVSHIHAHAQQQLAAQRELTSTLVKEVRHRVKNHLQGIVGLLRRHQSTHPETSSTMDAAIGQLLTISAVYGLEARVNDDNIYLCSVIAEIVKVLRTTYQTDNIEIPPANRTAQLAEEYSVPIALVINELITNAIKHTQPSGKARIKISTEFDPHYTRVKIYNAPASLPAANDSLIDNTKGAGLNLVRSLLPMGLASLSIENAEDGVMTTLTLLPPIVALRGQ